jgi:hypothetical protein
MGKNEQKALVGILIAYLLCQRKNPFYVRWRGQEFCRIKPRGERWEG